MAKKTEEKKSLDDIVKDLDKQYGKGSVMHGDEIEKYEDVVSTGSLGLDIATGIGGIPVGSTSGKVIELFGWESSGKSTLVQSIIGNYQKKFGRECLYVDGENSIDEKYSTALGVDLKKLWTVQLDESAGEGAYNKAEKLVESGEFGLVIYDSYNSLQPKKIIDGEVGDNNLGLHARMLGQAVQKANNLCTKYGTTFIFVGQLREKIGVMFGSPETTQGGNALRFYAHMRMKVQRSVAKDNTIMDGDTKIGNLVTVDVIKNKLAPPFKRAQFNILYGVGIDKIQEILDIGHDLEVLKVRGESLTYDETKYTINDFKQMLIDNPVFEEELRTKIINKCKN